MHPEEGESLQKLNHMREGFCGWMGFGGSIFQWHPVHQVAFAFTPDQMHWHDLMNARGARLQQQVIKCVRKMEQGSS